MQRSSAGLHGEEDQAGPCDLSDEAARVSLTHSTTTVATDTIVQATLTQSSIVLAPFAPTATSPSGVCTPVLAHASVSPSTSAVESGPSTSVHTQARSQCRVGRGRTRLVDMGKATDAHSVRRNVGQNILGAASRHEDKVRQLIGLLIKTNDILGTVVEV